MRETTSTAVATMAACLVGLVAFRFATDGFGALTVEAARRLAAQRGEMRVPDLLGTDQQGRIHDLVSDPESPGQRRVIILDFISLRCESLCSALGTNGQRLQAEIRRRHAEYRVRLVTVTLEPDQDTPAELSRYARRMNVDPRIWTLLASSRPEQWKRMLRTLGIVLIRVSPGQIEHNAAFHLVDGTRRVVRIVELKDSQDILSEALSIARTPPSTS